MGINLKSISKDLSGYAFAVSLSALACAGEPFVAADCAAGSCDDPSTPSSLPNAPEEPNASAIGSAPGADPVASPQPEATCGDALVSGAETCDGNCPTTCEPSRECFSASLSGLAAECTAECVETPVGCGQADGCCPDGCNISPENLDPDCPSVCGNGAIEGAEQCDGSANILVGINCAALGGAEDPMPVDCGLDCRIDSTSCCNEIQWTLESTLGSTVSSAADAWMAMGVDGENRAHVAFSRSGTQNGVGYAVNTDGVWISSTAGTEDGTYVSMVLDRDNSPHLAFLAATATPRGLRYAWRDGEEWQVETPVPGGVSLETSIAVNSDGAPHIMFTQGTSLHVAKRTDTGWGDSETPFTSTVGSGANIRIDAEDNLHAVWHNADAVWYSVTHDGEWVEPMLIERGPARSFGYSNTFVLDDKQTPHVAYRDTPSNSLRYATLGESGWQATAVVSGRVMEHHNRLGIAVNTFGQPHIAHLSEVDGQSVLMTAFFNGTSWRHIPVLPNPVANAVAVSSAVALNAEGWPHFAYHVGARTLLYSRASCLQ